MLLFQSSSWGGFKNNCGCVDNNMDRYNITYQGRGNCSYLKSRERRDFLEAVGHNDGCVSGGVVVSGKVGSSGGAHCRHIILVGGRWYMRQYESVYPSGPGVMVLWQRRRRKGKLAQILRK